MSTTRKIEETETYKKFQYPRYLATFIEKHGDITGPPVCEKCETTYTRDKWGWFCYLCKDELSSLVWKEVNDDKKKRIEANDRFWEFMQVRHRPRNEPYSSE